MGRIADTFSALAGQGRKALIPYIMAGDPSPTLTVELLHTLVEGGADVIELGVPFSMAWACIRPWRCSPSSARTTRRRRWC